MKRIIVILTLLLMIFSATYGQTANDSIQMKKVFAGYQFYQDGKRLTVSQLVKAMQPNEQAYQAIRQAQSSYTLASVIGGAGGFMVGWPLGAALAGGKANWTMAGIGAGLIVVSIPISSKFNKQAKNAVENFNAGLRPIAFWDTHELRIASSGNGVGLLFHF